MSKMIGPFGSMLIVVGCLASTVFAQGGNAVINGTVFDQAKSVLPGVTVTVTNEATGISREAVSGPRGALRCADVVAGYIHHPDDADRLSGPETRRDRRPHRSGVDHRSHDVCRRCRGTDRRQCPDAHHRDDGQPHRRRRLRPGDRPAPQPGTQSSLVDAARAGPGAGADAGRVRRGQLQHERAYHGQQPVDR